MLVYYNKGGWAVEQTQDRLFAALFHPIQTHTSVPTDDCLQELGNFALNLERSNCPWQIWVEKKVSNSDKTYNYKKLFDACKKL